MKKIEKPTKAAINAAKRRAARAKRSKRNLSLYDKMYAQYPNLPVED